jgi:hypothetical protein
VKKFTETGEKLLQIITHWVKDGTTKLEQRCTGRASLKAQ